MAVDLGGGQADPAGRVHGFGHVVDQLPQFLVEHGYGFRHRAEPGVGKFQDFESGHGALRLSLV